MFCEHRGNFRHIRGFAPRGFGHREEMGGEERGPRGPWGRGRGFGRPFDHGELRFVILGLIAEKPRHGYEIIKAIEEQFGGGYTPSPGVVYPTLTMLEDMGYATAEQADGKKSYTITEQGKLFLAGNAASADSARKRMEEAGAGRGRGPAPELFRAMGNLRNAVRSRVKGGHLTEEQLKKVVEAIDAAARAIAAE